jgi:murein DD-endopeptidase MepM/ murein hydrolase activator NlpD
MVSFRKQTGRVSRWAVAVAVLVATVVVPASAQEDLSIDEARARKDEVLAEKAQLAAELDPLLAEENELFEAVTALDESIWAKQAEVEAAAAAVLEADLRAAQLQAEVDAVKLRTADVRNRAAAGIVDAYVGATGRDSDLTLTAESATDVVKKRQFLGVVQGNYQTSLEELRALLQDSERIAERARVAVEEAATLRGQLQAAEAELQIQRDAQGLLLDALAGKIDNLEAKKSEFEAAEARFDDIIRTRLAEQDAAAAAALAAQQAASGGGGSGGGSITVSGSSASGFVYPAGGPITSYYGYRIHPILGYSRLHAGLDIGAPYGDPVWAAKGGTVIFAGWNGGYGNCVMIAHSGGVVTLYGHLSEIAIGEGSSVSQGTIIGYIGSTGQSTGPHLHFETRVYDDPQDPLNFLP